MKELLIATTNAGKMREIREFLKDMNLKVTCLADYPGFPKVVEDGTTFRQNAIKKAREIAKFSGCLTLGEDSGLEVAALDQQPGIYAARYSGENATDQKNNEKLLKMLARVPVSGRQARYRCLAALWENDKLIGVAEGRCSGIIAKNEKGKNGFGYDPLFIIAKYGKTFGELDAGIKSQISHRAKAFAKIKAILTRYLAQT